MTMPWAYHKIGDLCEILNGGTPKTGTQEYWDGTNPWITPAEMGKLTSPYMAETTRAITDSGLKNSSARMLPPYSVILSSRAPIGHLVINTVSMATNQGCKGLVPSSRLYYKYLYYFLYRSVDHLNDIGTGTTFKELSGARLKEVLIPVPPLDEQKHIVEILDQAFEAIAVAKTNTEKNLANAREAYRNYLATEFISLRESFGSITLGEICILENGDRGEHYPGRNLRTASGIPFINAGHLTEENGLDFESMDFISRERFNLLRNGKIRADDILFCLRGSLGKFASVGTLKEGAIASSLVILRPKASITNDYLLKFLASDLCLQEIQARRGGTAQPNLGAKDLKLFKVPFPSLDIQNILTEKMQLLELQTQFLVSQYIRKLAALDDLKQSLLHAAFSGELTSREIIAA